jgi:hypothetical protein
MAPPTTMPPVLVLLPTRRTDVVIWLRSALVRPSWAGLAFEPRLIASAAVTVWSWTMPVPAVMGPLMVMKSAAMPTGPATAPRLVASWPPVPLSRVKAPPGLVVREMPPPWVRMLAPALVLCWRAMLPTNIPMLLPALAVTLPAPVLFTTVPSSSTMFLPAVREMVPPA